jgi:hypothetical protein
VVGQVLSSQMASPCNKRFLTGLDRNQKEYLTWLCRPNPGGAIRLKLESCRKLRRRQGARNSAAGSKMSTIPVSAGDPGCGWFYLSSVLSHAKNAASESGLRLLRVTPTANHTLRSRNTSKSTCPGSQQLIDERQLLQRMCGSL